MAKIRVMWLIVGVLLAACRGRALDPLPVEGPAGAWTFADLRQLDALDAPSAERELIALYTRFAGNDFQIRLDLLELADDRAFDLYLSLDLEPGGGSRLPFNADPAVPFDLLLELKQGQPPRALDSTLALRDDLIPRAVYDPALDTLTISLNRLSLPPDLRRARIEVFVQQPGQLAVADHLPPVWLFNQIRQPRAPVILVFWNAFQARTPAQALRRWDGAHTGPYGERHGLRNLLTAARTAGVPVTLLDLKTPASLGALDFLGVLPVLQPLIQAGLVDTPDAVPVNHQASAGFLPFSPPPGLIAAGVQWSRETGLAHGFPSGLSLYAPLVPEDTSGYRLLILPRACPDAAPTCVSSSQQQGQGPEADFGLARLKHWAGARVFELPAFHPLPQATDNGISLDIRRALVNLALSEHQANQPAGAAFLALGGDLTISSWGDPQAARNSLRYIAAHPWIHPLGLEDLLAFDASRSASLPEPAALRSQVPLGVFGAPIASRLKVDELAGLLWRQIEDLPDEMLRHTAQEGFFGLLASNPPDDSRLPDLRTGYVSQLGGLLGAMKAADQMVAGDIDCQADPDYDGEPECMLRSDTMILVIESLGAQVTHALALTPEGWRQWIAPFAQFATGLGDPESWDTRAGPAGDPASVPGAFSDIGDRWRPYMPVVLPNGVRYESIDGQQVKTYQWTPHGLRVTYETPPGVETATQIPLALAANGFGSPLWAAGYRLETRPDGLIWGREAGFRVAIETDSAISIAAYRDSAQEILFPEDPNLDYPPGHFLPLQTTLLEIRGTGNWQIVIRILGPEHPEQIP